VAFFRLRQQIFVFSRIKMTAMCESAARCLESPANFRTRPARRSLMGTLTGKDTVAWFALKSEYKGIIRKICGSTEANYPCSCMRCLLPKSKTIHVRHRHIEVNVTTETRVPGRKSAWLRFQTHTHSIVTVVALHSILLARHTCSREEMLQSVKTSLHNTFRSRTDRLLVEWDSFLSS